LPSEVIDVLGGNIIVQSSHKSASFLISRIEDFINNMDKLMDSLTEEEFEKSRKAVITIKSQKDL
jgi:secreted Zn-dependent insulinase-like peptidase